MSASRRPSSAGSDSSVDSQDPNVTIKRVLRREYAEKYGIDYTRPINIDGTKGHWQKVEEPITAPQGPTPRQLYLVRLKQAEGEPYHWCLTTCDAVNGDFRGNVYEVKGDAVYMEYQPSSDGELVNILISDIIEDYYMLASNLTPQMEAIVERVSEAEPPPRANSMRDATENCQGWTIRVREKLKAMNVIERDVDFFRGLLQPVK